MIKLLASLVTVAVLTYFAFMGLSQKSLSPRESLEASLSDLASVERLQGEKLELLKIQVAVQDFKNKNGNHPEKLAELVPDYFDSVPKNPRTGEEIEYERDGETFNLGSEVYDDEDYEPSEDLEALSELMPVESVEGIDNFVNPNTMEIEAFTYDPQGRRDPFEPFDYSPVGQVDLSKPPLERYELGQLRITAILEDSRTPGEKMAIVEDATGRGYTVRKGTKIGRYGGVIVSVTNDRINVIETKVDFTGKETKVPVVMKKPPRDPNAKKKTRRKRR